MANLRTTIVIFLSIIAAIASADVLSEQQISQIAKMYNSKSEGLYTCKSVGRTIVFIFETVPENDVTKEQIIDYFSKEQAANMAVNAINVEYDFTIYGKIEKRIKINWYEFLNLSYKSRNLYNTIKSNKSHGVNMQFVYPKGWSVQEGDGPHVINNFNFKNDFISILIDDSPTFFSKNESIDLLNNRAPNLLNIDNLQKKLNNRFIEIYRTDVSNDIVGNYPAKKFYTDGTVSMKGIQFRCVMITWFILYDDKQITFGGVFMVNSDMELKIKETIMEKIALTVRFPDQYTD